MLFSTISTTFFVIIWLSIDARPISVPVTFPDSKRPITNNNYNNNRRPQINQSDYQRPPPVRGEARPNTSNTNGKLFFNSFQRPQQYYPDDSQQQHQQQQQYYPQRPIRPTQPQTEVTTDSQSSEEIPDYDEVLSDDNNGQSGSTSNDENRLSINSKFGGFHDQRHHHRKKYKKKHGHPCVPYQGSGYFRQNNNNNNNYQNNNGNGKTFFDFKRFTIPVPFPYPYPYPIYDTYGGYPCVPFESHPHRPHRPHRPNRPNRPHRPGSGSSDNNNGVFQDELDGTDDVGSTGNGGTGSGGDNNGDNNGGSNASNIFFGQGGLFDFSEGAGGNQVIKPVIDTFADTVQNVSQNWMPGQVVGGILNSVGGFIQQIRPAAAVAMAGDVLSDAGRNFNNLLIRPFYDLFR